MKLRPNYTVVVIQLIGLIVGLFTTPLLDAQQDFDHAQHVDDRWLTVVEDEVWRDCNGCHRLEETQSRQRDWDPAIGNVCESCHQTGVDPSFREFPRPTPAEPDQRLFFFHGDHEWGTEYTVDGKTKKLVCRDCHATDGEKVPEKLPRPNADRAFCVSCHGEGDTFSQSFIDRVNERVEGGTSGAKVFRHNRDEHRQDCRSCHTAMQSAPAGDFAEYMFDVNACQKCHADDDLEVTVENIERESATRNTFFHGLHLTASAIDKRPELGECTTCHVYDGVASYGLKPEFTQPTARGELGPVACKQCHEDWAVESHGQVGSCRACHDLERGEIAEWGELKKHRGRFEARRPRASTFAITTHRHKFLGDDPANACESCHVAALDEQPSRFQGHPFKHWPHLSDNPTAEECRVCHGNAVARATDLKYLAVSHEGEIPLNYDRNACESCHPGRDPAPDFANLQKREVIEFNHFKHRQHDCTECHIPPTAGDLTDGDDLSIPGKIASCTKCHGHETPEQIARSGNVSLDQLRACQNCHLADSGLPVPGRKVMGQRKRISQLRGDIARHHSTDDPCDTCHTPRNVRDQRMSSKKNIDNPHNTVGIPQSSLPHGLYCIDCHWGKTDLPRGKKNAWASEPYGKLIFEYEVRDQRGAERTVGTEKRRFPGYRNFPPKR